MRTLVERASRWLVNNRRPPLDSRGAPSTSSASPVQQVMAAAAGPDDRPRAGGVRAAPRRAGRRSGVPEDLATRVAVLPPAYMLLGIVETADRDEARPARGRPGALRARRAARAARRWSQRILGAAARGPLADDGPRRRCATTCTPCTPSSPRRCWRRPTPTTRAPARIAAWEDGDERAWSAARGDHARGDLRRRRGRPGPDVGGPARGPRAALHRLTPYG